MANPEKKNLLLIGGSKNHPSELHINPRCYSSEALKDIVGYQILSPPSEITIKKGGFESINLSRKNLNNARKSDRGNCRFFIELITSIMFNADTVIIKKTNYSEEFIKNTPTLSMLDK